jgi:CHAT domain-containing protein
LNTLPHALRESNAVWESFSDFPIGERVALCEGNATEASVRQTIERSRFIHLAVHGFVDHENDNLAGGLALAPGPAAEQGASDGLLQLQELYGLNLANCELAALSACQTNVGADRPLEAGMSMARAFLERGARRAVCSHWSIDDEATAEIISSFFWNMRRMRQEKQPIDYATALWNAKRQLRENARWRANPGYWSAIVLVGR